MQWETAKPTGPVSEILPANAARCWKAKITLCVPVGPSFVSMTAAGKGVITRHNPPSRVLDAAYMQREKGRKQLTKAKLLNCVRTACILLTQRPGYSPKNTSHLTGCTVKQQSPHENDETAFNLVLHCPYEQTTQPCEVRLLRVFQCPWLRSWRRR